MTDRPTPAQAPNASSNQAAPLTGNALIAEARAGLTPSTDARSRVGSIIQKRIAAPRVFADARRALTPSTSLSQRLWQSIMGRLQPVSVAAYGRPQRALKLVAAFALLLLAVRISPILFLAPPIVAESSVTLVRTQGSVSVLREGLWQPVDGETTLSQEATIRTDNGEATIISHDDFVVRLAPHTTITVHDLTDRPSTTNSATTFSLQGGQVWVLSLLPRPLAPIRIGTAEAHVEVQEGSISLLQTADGVTVDAWDRSASVVRRGKRVAILAGEHFAIQQGRIVVSTLEIARYQDLWVAKNLSRDAVHQREIAHVQQERRVAAAGILPDSTLYPAKRLAEAVDVLFTLTPEGRAKKRITQANTRLNEAAALIARGSGSDATAVLQEYQDTLLAVASGSGGNQLALHSLLHEEVVEKATAETAAALPDDEGYILKEAVREAIAQLPETVDKPSDIHASELLDRLSSVRQQVAEGNSISASQVAEVTALLHASESAGALPEDVLEELRANFSTVIAVVDEEDELYWPDSAAAELARTRTRGEPSARPPMTDAEVESKVQEILGHIAVFTERKPKLNTFRAEMKLLDGQPDEGRILRRLEAHAETLPPGFMNLIRREIDELNGRTEAVLEQDDGGTGALVE